MPAVRAVGGLVSTAVLVRGNVWRAHIQKKEEKIMYAKNVGLVFANVLAISLLASSSAQSRSVVEAMKEVDISAHPNGSIVILNKEETGLPGYVHTQYAFIDQKCGAVLVDRYGGPVDPNDKELKQVEQQMCSEIGTGGSRESD
jgi:hypothetical protein